MMKTLLKWVALIISWLTLSPLMVYLGHRWKMGNKYVRIIGMLVSPLFLIIYLLLFIVICYEDKRDYFQNRDRIERITEVRLPKFKMIEYHEGRRGFNGDFNDDFVFEFKSVPSDEMFDMIDKLIESGKTGWHKEGDSYIFNCTWGNGMPAPKGESDNEDRIFGITITRGEKQGVIRHGMW